MFSLLAFDPSKVSSGWAYFEDGILKDYGIIKIKYNTKEEAHLGKYLSELSYEMAVLINKLEPEMICAEEAVGGGSTSVTQSLAQVFGVLHKSSYMNGRKGLPVGLARPSAVRKPYGLNSSTKKWKLTKFYTPELYTLKSHEAKSYKLYTKQLIIDFINKEYNLELVMKENDIADAILMGRYTLDKLKKGSTMKKETTPKKNGTGKGTRANQGKGCNTKTPKNTGKGKK